MEKGKGEEREQESRWIFREIGRVREILRQRGPLPITVTVTKRQTETCREKESEIQTETNRKRKRDKETERYT